MLRAIVLEMWATAAKRKSKFWGGLVWLASILLL
jgi:hypothetical protein